MVSTSQRASPSHCKHIPVRKEPAAPFFRQSEPGVLLVADKFKIAPSRPPPLYLTTRRFSA